MCILCVWLHLCEINYIYIYIYGKDRAKIIMSCIFDSVYIKLQVNVT